jgi:hypothetical protein
MHRTISLSSPDGGSVDLASLLRGQIAMDAEFLCSQEVIDYSLLLGVAAAPGEDDGRRRGRGLGAGDRESLSVFRSHHGGMAGCSRLRATEGTVTAATDSEREEVLFVGIIDTLVPFSKKKKMEYQAKSVMQRGKNFSVIPPKEYCERFIAANTTIVTQLEPPPEADAKAECAATQQEWMAAVSTTELRRLCALSATALAAVFADALAERGGLPASETVEPEPEPEPEPGNV